MKTIPEFYEKHSKCSHYFKDKVAFFLIGKGGCGTVTKELSKNKIRVSSSHPYPKESRVRELQTSMTTLIVNVRDPVDRFVSAFRWRMAVLCHPDDHRERVRKGAANNPYDKCKTSTSLRKEERMLRETYGSDPSVLTEALCGGSPSRERAVEYYSSIQHSTPIAEWLDFLIGPEMLDRISDGGIRNFIALPLEKQGDDEPLFESHIQQLSLHLLQTRYDRETAVQIMKQKPRKKGSTTKKKSEHSSVKFHNSTNTTIPVALSPLGECCLTRHLQQDYRLIRTMLGDDKGGRMANAIRPLVDAHPAIQNACLWGSEEQQELYRSDLRSMLVRRARYLDVSMGNCHDAATHD